jgi:hypothetical protein
MAIQCAATTGIMPGGALAIGVSGRDERTRYAAAIVDRVCRLDDGRISVRARVGGALAAILEHELLRPAYRLESLRFEYVVSARILDRLADVGILERTVVDRVYRCPQCGGLPICRSGCNTCHSPLVQTDELIHHYACAHVGSVEQFRDGDRLRCSKCQMGPLIIGSDFEYLPGLHTCLNCSRTGSQLQLRGTCTLCHHDFQVDPSTAHDLIGFRPNRLDLTDG